MPILPPLSLEIYRGQYGTVWNDDSPAVGDISIFADLVGYGTRQTTTYITYAVAPVSTSIAIEQISPEGVWMTVYTSKNVAGEVIGDLGLDPRSLRAVQNGTATGITVSFQRW